MYNNIIIDSFCQANKTFLKDEGEFNISNKPTYKKSICFFIKSIENIVDKYLSSDGKVYLLFDYFFTKNELSDIFKNCPNNDDTRRNIDNNYKKNRKQKNNVFYNSLSLIKYYYSVMPSNYNVLMIRGYEGDDLVPHILNSCEGKNLLVTTDHDWYKYLNKDTDILSDMSVGAESIYDISNKLGMDIFYNGVVLYKALFGDVSDNIPSIISLNESTKSEFLNLYKNNPEDLILKSRDLTERQNNQILNAISKNENRFKINLQLVESLPLDDKRVQDELIIGTDNQTIKNTIRKVVGLDSKCNKFEFGNMKRKRV